MAVLSNPENPCPAHILQQQVALRVEYIDLAGRKGFGIIEINKTLKKDVRDFFNLALELGFPIERIVPASNENYKWDDIRLMEANVTSGFNYRLVAGTNELSNHATGRAFDINTQLNPCIRYEGTKLLVNGKEAKGHIGDFWNKNKPGTLFAEHPLVIFMLGRGWEWGGNWTLATEGIVDYQHFQKPKEKIN